MELNAAQEQLKLVRSLFPDLAETLDSAHAKHGPAEAHHADSAAGFDAWLDQEAERLRGGSLASAPFAMLPTHEASRFERAFAATRTVSQRIGLVPPEPEAFAEAGCELTVLAQHLAHDPSLLPVPAPYGLGAERWCALFRSFTADVGSPFLKPEPLHLATEVLDGFATLDDAPDVSIPSVSIDQPGHRSIRWTLRLIPAGPKPSLLGLSYAHGPHVTLPEMLMLQLMHVAEGEAPVDRQSFTWLAGSLADGKLAARHVFDEQEGVIRLNCREFGNQGPHLGARPPIG